MSDLRAELIAAILESVRTRGRAPTAQIGAERAADAMLPIVQRVLDAEWEGITVRGLPPESASPAGES